MDKLKNLRPEHKLLLSIGVLGLVAGLYYVLVIQDLDGQLATASARLQQLTTEKNKFKDFEGAVEIERLKDQYAQVLRQIEENKKVLPEEDRVAEFIHSLETDAEEAGVRILSYEPAKPGKGDLYAEIPLDMSIGGTYLQFVRFLKLMAEPKKRLANVHELELFADKTTANDPVRTTPFGA
ncbi:MAG: type 4a pilus biogenesis protein PilO, partial [Deltaproteobacteria bacterium]|nr:type 4a pilus biogenesis protein PilO [Deltaproteobacteria bacterium]